jgi:hypothetical protein
VEMDTVEGMDRAATHAAVDNETVTRQQGWVITHGEVCSVLAEPKRLPGDLPVGIRCRLTNRVEPPRRSERAVLLNRPHCDFPDRDRSRADNFRGGWLDAGRRGYVACCYDRS